jgi:hypothetical protein
MFRAAYRSSSGALTAFAASGLHTHVVTDRSQVRVGSMNINFVSFLFPHQVHKIRSDAKWDVCL